MNFAKFSVHAVPLFISTNILPLPLLYFKNCSILMHDVHNKVVPSNISDFFTPTKDVHHYNTRSSTAGDFYIIFIDMFAPKWTRGPHNLARFPFWDPCITPGYWAWYLNALPTSGSLIRSLFYAFMPREGIYTCVFCPPPPLSDENPVMLHFFAYAEIIFAHILVFPACAIEVQHINENSPTNYSPLNHYKNSFSIMGAKIWNSIPDVMRQLRKYRFKK